MEAEQEVQLYEPAVVEINDDLEVTEEAVSEFPTENETEETQTSVPEASGDTAIEESQTSYRFMLSTGLTGDGDELGEVYTYSTFGSRDSETIYAGSLWYIGVGVEFLFENDLSLEMLLGYHFDSVDGDDGSVGFDRIPLDLNVIKTFDKHRVGLGLSYHVSPEFDLADAGGPTFEFDDALGLSLNYGYQFDGFILGFKYLSIDYELDNINGFGVGTGEVDGSYFGIFITAVGSPR